MKRICSILLVLSFLICLGACGNQESSAASTESAASAASAESAAASSAAEASSVGSEEPAEASSEAVSEAEEVSEEEAEPAAVVSDKEYIEETLNLRNNPDQEWTYSADADAWVLSVTSAVVYPVLPDQQGVSVCVPGAYVTGIDTDGDGEADVKGADAAEAVCGSLVIDYEAEVTSTNGQVYTAATAPLILNTGAAGYGSQSNNNAGTGYAAEGYINIACGNRGKQDSITAEDGTVTYVGDAPSCLVDQKNAARFVRYNILLGNLPGSTEYLVSTGGSGGGAHAAMFAATSNNPDFYDYEIEAGAVGVYACEDGSYVTTVTIDGEEVSVSDGAWGTVAYSAITSLYEGDITMAMEYYLDPDYSFSTDFQAKMAEYLAEAYMEYINDQNLSIEESAAQLDINGDGDMDDTVDLTIEYDPDGHAETRGYYGTYLDLYLAEFQSNLQWYLDNLVYADGWTWFDEDGAAYSDEALAALSGEDLAAAFLEGRYAKSSAGGMGGPGGGMGGPGGGMGGPPDGGMGGPPDMGGTSSGTEMVVGTPDEGTTQSASGSANSSNYSDFESMVEEYRQDIEEVEAGDAYGKNLVDLYNPLNYIGAEGTENPTWTRVVMGASEGDMSMFASLNMQIKWLAAGVDSVIEWQWDGGHVPSEILGESLALYVDEMYGKHVDGAVAVEKPEPDPITANGTDTEASGTDISSWVDASDLSHVTFSLADAAAYRTAGASKAIPGFDVIDYGQEDYVFGSSTKDARHWDTYVLAVFEEHADELAELF